MIEKNTGYPSIDRLHDKGYNFFRRHPMIPNLNIYNSVKLLNATNLNAEAVDSIHIKLTYKELLEHSDMLAKSFKELGIKKGDIITVCMQNCYQAIVAYLAANKIGAVTTFLNYYATPSEVEHYLNLYDSPLLINFDKSHEYNEKIKKETNVSNIITLKKEDLYKKDYNKDNSKAIGYNSFLSFNDMELVSNFYKGFITSLGGGKNDSLIQYTSGSSGNPKNVVLTNENILSSGIYTKNTIFIHQNKNDRCLTFVPFKYPYGFVTSILLTLLCGKSIVMAPEGLNRDNAAQLLSNIIYYYGSPAFIFDLKKYVPDGLDLSSATTYVTGGDFFTEKIRNEARKFFHEHNNDDIIYCNGAGNAETAATWASAVGTPVREETVGKILIGSEPIIINPDTKEEVKYGEEGTLLLSGKHVFKGYYQENGRISKPDVYYKGKKYYNTQTRGYIDEDRYFTLTGRDSRFYILGSGVKVYCEKVEKFITGINGVLKCVVVAKPDDENRFSGKAYVTLQDGVVPDKEMVDKIYNAFDMELANYGKTDYNITEQEIPASIDFVDNIKITEAEKTDYRYYEQLAEEEYEKEKNNLNVKKLIK